MEDIKNHIMFKSPYPNCEKYGLKAIYVDDCTTKYIKASEVEALLSSGFRVQGFKDTDASDNMGWCMTEKEGAEQVIPDTHEALCIGLKPIEKEQPVSVDEFVKFFTKHFSDQSEMLKEMHELQKRLKATKELR